MSDRPTDDPTTEFALSRSLGAIAPVARRIGISRTEALNRAARLYPALTELGLWTAIRLLLAERAELRRLATARAQLAEEAS